MSDVSIARRPDPIAQALDWLLVWRHPRLWLAYSIAFGVVAPIVCFAVATSLGMFDLAALPLELYALIAVATMAAWLAFGRNREWLNAVASGVLFGGALFAVPCAFFFGALGVLSLALAPIMGGAAVTMGVLAFQPTFALVAYAVNAWRAGRASHWPSALPVIAFMLSAAIPLAAWLALRSAGAATERAILESERPLAELDLARWRCLAPNHHWPGLRRAYPAPEGKRNRRIADAYVELTGESIYFSD